MRFVVFCFLILPAMAMAVNVAEVQQAIGELGATKFATRQAGIDHLLKLGDDDHKIVLQECLQAYQHSDDPEVRIRLRSVLQSIVDKYLYRGPRGFLGIRMNNNIIINNGGRIIINNVTVPSGSIWVAGVVENTAAQKAGLQANDFIISIDGTKDLKSTEFVQYVASKQPGDHVKLDVIRGDATNDLDVVLGDWPPEQRQLALSEEGSRDYFKKWLQDHAPTNAPAPDAPKKP